MSEEQPNNPLHGVTLELILEALVEQHGWPGLAAKIKLRCFQNEPSVRSSLKFLRKTPWARAEVERLYLRDRQRADRNRKRNKRRAYRRARRAEFSVAHERLEEDQAGHDPDQVEGEQDAHPLEGLLEGGSAEHLAGGDDPRE